VASCKPEKEIPKDIISQQNERIQQFIKERGWKLVKKYADRKKNIDAEEAFQQMRSDGIERKFDMVVVDSLFRCGKNVSYAEDVLLKTFYFSGIHLSVVEDNLCSMDMTLEEVKSYFKKRKNEYIGAVLTANTRKKQAEGYLSVHDEKYGYLLNEDRKGLVVDEEVVPIIKEIFYLLAEEEKTFKQVAEIMNEHGYESPMKHLTRVGLKRRPDVESQWASGAVKRISENTAYIGYWKKQVDGEKVVIKTEAIIEEAQFNKVQDRYERRVDKKKVIGKRSNNAFMKQIFDKTTGKPLHCHLFLEPEEYMTFNIHHDAAERIGYDIVMQTVVGAIKAEREKAKLALEWIETEDGIKEKENQREEFAERAKELFMELSLIEQEHIPLYCQKENGVISDMEYQFHKKEILERLSEKETEFAALMEEVEKLELAFSKRNPWIQLYNDLNVPDTLTKPQIRKWIDKVLVENLETVEVIFPNKYTQWRDRLPIKCFVEMEKNNG
jgi:DNA invertase Pin-like site-specific DNA recombinase